jgi:hypothetical protein
LDGTVEVLPEIEGQLSIPSMEMRGSFRLDAKNEAEFHFVPFVKQHEVMKLFRIMFPGRSPCRFKFEGGCLSSMLS